MKRFGFVFVIVTLCMIKLSQSAPSEKQRFCIGYVKPGSASSHEEYNDEDDDDWNDTSEYVTNDSEGVGMQINKTVGVC